MRARVGAATGVLALVLTLTALATAASQLTATALRIGDHAGFTRVVVDFKGGTVKLGEAMLVSSARLFSAGRATVTITRGGVRTSAHAAGAHGVSAHITQRTGHITISVSGGAHRFKALRESALHSPERLVLDLWKAAPPSAAATVRNDGCLAIDGFILSPGGQIDADGRVLRQLFENTFAVTVRGAGGAVIRRRTVTHGVGFWHVAFGYHVSHTQRGTLEAAAFSAKDGSLECLAQVPLTLAP